MGGMWAVNIEVKDPDAYDRYLQNSGRVATEKGGTFIARAGRYTQKEGKEFSRNVLVQFDTYEAAVEAYESDDYQEILPDALAGAVRQFLILETID